MANAATRTRDWREAAERLRGRADEHRHTLARTDTTSATLLALAMALLAGLGGAAAIVRPRLTVVPVAVAGVGTVALVGAVLCALAAMRPRTGNGGPAADARRDPDELAQAAARMTPYEVALDQARDLVALARITTRKHRLQQYAVDQLAVAALLYLAAVGAVGVVALVT